MHILASLLRYVVEFLSGLALAFTLLPFAAAAITGSPKVPIYVAWALCLVVAALLVVLVERLAGIPRGRKVLPYDSPKFVKFYSEWYKSKGKISVFCDDTDWLEDPERAPIVAALVQKGDRASLFVRQTQGPVVATLRAAKVKIVQIPPTVSFEARLSLRAEDGKKLLIIRDSRAESRDHKSKKNIFIQTSDANLVALAEDLLNSISN